jgi:hypothetical protein
VKLSDLTPRDQETQTEADGPQVFSDHVRALASGETLDDRQFATMWRALGAALRRELKRRGLWESAPAFLGVYGGESWQAAPGGPPGKAAQDPLEELLAECYVYIFVDRLRSLRAQLLVKPNIEGLVTLNIRHFLHERQKSHDPIGFQIFEVVRAAVRSAVDKGELRVLSGDESVRNDTVLGFPHELDRPGSRGGTLASRVARWNDELLPGLVTSRGRRQEEVVEQLSAHLPDLQRWGFLSFRFKDLVDPLKADVRARWAALLEIEEGESVPQHEEGSVKGGVRAVGPDTGIEERQIFQKLIDCVLQRLERLETSGRTREYLAVLWQFLRVQASEGMASAPASRLDRALAAELAEEMADDDENLSLRSLAEKLRIPRERLPGLYRKLGELVNGCRAAISGKGAVISLMEKSVHAQKEPTP